ncbi:MAG: HepT-like ribonuclease domain-containing protein [Nostoc sp.]
MKQSYTEFLQDILDAITEIELFISGVSYKAFESNREKTLAVVKLLEVIGEAVKKIPNERREQYPDIPWKSIAGMKDMLVHEYWQVDVAVVWATVQHSLPSLKAEEHTKNNLPDVLSRWRSRNTTERERSRTAQSFCVPNNIAAQGYDLSLNRYKEVVHEEVEHRAPKDILANLAKLEAEIQQGMKELEGMLG